MKEIIISQTNCSVELVFKLDESTTMATSFYSGGEGGGSGSAVLSRSNGASDYDATIARNMSDAQWKDGYHRGVLRGSRNNQSTYGIMSKMEKEMTDTVSMTVGLDARTAKVEHYRQVYDLLGGDFFYNTSNPNWTEEQRHTTW